MTEHPGHAPGPHYRHAAQPPRTGGITQLVFTDSLPRSEGARVAPGGKVIFVNSAWGTKGRRTALRNELRRAHRFPGLALPLLAVAGIRRFIYGVSDWATAVIQHGGAIVANNTGAAIIGTAVIVAGGVGASVATGVVNVPSIISGTPAPHAASPPKPIRVRLPAYPASYLGAYEADSPASYAQMTEFAVATRHRPNLALYYASIREQFQTAFAEAAYQNGATPVIQIDPDGVPIADIAAGVDDSYIDALAAEVHAYGHGVVIGFAHEMNGGWYAWGYGHTKPAAWIAAWRHVVNVFRAAGDYNVTWLWTISRSNAGTGPIQDWWPGASYVTWVGIDGYFYLPSDTFASEFGGAISRVRQLTSDPILLAETAAGPGPEQAAQIRMLFHGIRDRQILGFIWFDRAQHAGVYHQDWRLEDYPSALRAFRKAARGYGAR